ncbi:hypothetical protein BGX27_009739 [Mortierella sp. AM989]|nr:hypothetical protein BGX27_009739 [Mortierella sp. AM989]
MEVIQEDNPNHNYHVQPPPAITASDNHRGITSSASPAQSADVQGSTTTPIHTMLSTMAPTTPPSSISSHLQVQQIAVEGAETASLRQVDKNWARVRQKVVGNDSAVEQAVTSDDLETNMTTDSTVTVTSNSSTQHEPQKNSDMHHAASRATDQSRTYPLVSTEGLGIGAGVGAGTGTGTGTGSVSTSIRGVLGFRNVVVQRTQLRKMEKEIEKVILRYANDQTQPRSRTTPKIATAARGARGMMPGTSYNLLTMPESSSVDRNFIDEISEILTRWKGLTAELPCRIDILRILARMLQIDRPEAVSRKRYSSYTGIKAPAT